MKEPLNTASAAKVVGKSPHWLYVNAERLQIPRYRIGGRWIYFENELTEWFMNQRISPNGSEVLAITRNFSNRKYVNFS
jgi:hypothetical protein